MPKDKGFRVDVKMDKMNGETRTAPDDSPTWLKNDRRNGRKCPSQVG